MPREKHQKKHRKSRHKQDKPQPTLETLPTLALNALFLCLTLPDIANLTQVSKKLADAVIKDQDYWKQALALHFQETYLAYQVPRYTIRTPNWFNRFKHIYHDAYIYNNRTYNLEYMSPRERRIITLIKIGDLAQLQAMTIGFCIIHLQSKRNMLALAANPNQALRDYCYNAFILPHFTRHSAINLTKKDGRSKTIIHWAVLLNQETAIQDFITKQANFCHIDTDGNPPLNYAIITGNLNMVNLLIANMGDFLTEDINIYPDYVESPLCLAVKHQHLDIVQALFAHGMRNSNIFRGIIHDYPFTLAIKSGNHAMVTFLLSHSPKIDINATPNYRYYYGLTGLPAIFYAVKNEDFVMLELLISLKGNINRASDAWKTPLGCAVENASYDVAEWLLEHGANPNISKDPPLPIKDYALPIDLATKNNNLAMLKLLLKYNAIVDCHYGEKARYLTKQYFMPDIEQTLNHAELKQLIKGIQDTKAIYPCKREHTVLFQKSPHPSRKKTIAAAKALKAVVKNKADMTTLTEHHETLLKHEHLRPIYTTYLRPL